MYFSLLAMLICLLIFLFVLYLLARDDFVLLRKNIPLEQTFNIAILALLFGLFAARLFYAFLHIDKGFMQPLIFLAFPYFPGFSAIGGVLGMAGFLTLYTIKHKIPTIRLLDFFSFALLPVFTFGLAGYALRSFIEKKNIGIYFFTPVIYLLVSSIFFIFLLPLYRKGEFKDGSISLLFLIPFSLVSLLTDILNNSPKLIFFFGFEAILSIIIFFTAAVFLIKQEDYLTKMKEIWSQK